MKKRLALIILMTLQTATLRAGWFSPDEETIELRKELTQQQQATGDWKTIAGALAIAAILTFVIGTMLGSKTRREHETNQ